MNINQVDVSLDNKQVKIEIVEVNVLHRLMKKNMWHKTRLDRGIPL